MKTRVVPVLILTTITMLFIAAKLKQSKNVLIVGDSISIGYTPYIQKALSPGVNVEHNPGNGGPTVRGVENIEKWIGNRDWDVIVFNFGLHDMVHKDSLNKYDVNGKVAVPLDQYRKNLEQIVSKLKETTASLLFVTTTVVPEGAAGRKVEDPAKYNQVAREVMKKNGIEVLDLYSVSQTVHPANSKPANVHYTEKGYELLADPIISKLRTLLKLR